ncbi:voltage-gated ion channel superfamily [Thraustotheca clavata]|uniref:Voltage-gated ion channel superfamily n=1 Tax=Thraustotheca clavata TaxID=74557 RepID=A0A1W0AAS1_9STRA|nr:voltage-gated ion channel superfamily [Thraustotheca clavata]
MSEHGHPHFAIKLPQLSTRRLSGDVCKKEHDIQTTIHENDLVHSDKMDIVPKHTRPHRGHGSTNKIIPLRDRLIRHSVNTMDDEGQMVMRKNKEFMKSKRVYQLNQLDRFHRRKAHLHPNSSFRAGWDLYMIFLLFWTSIVVPFEIAFVTTDSWTTLFIIDRVVDFSFLMDMIFNFMTPYVDKETNQLVEDPQMIIGHYIKGWFVADFVSILPFDLIGMYLPTDNGSSLNIKQLKIIRVIRLFRLVKLARVFRASRIYSRWEAILGFKYTNVKLVKFLSCVLMLAHWLACLWGLTPQLEVVPDGQMDWETAYHIADADESTKYIVSLYWSVMTIGTVGYGDVQPKTDYERVVCIACMLLGGGTYAYIIGAVCGLVAAMDESETEFNQQMDHLNVYMNKEKVPQAMKIKLRDYFLHSRDLLQHKYFSHVIATLSPGLRGLISVYTNGEWANNVHFFNGGPYDEHVRFVTAITQKLRAELYPPNENIIHHGDPTDKMYIVSKGIVARLGRVLGKGRFFGEDVILCHGVRNYVVRTLTFVDAYSLSRVDLEAVLANGTFPFKAKKIRVAAAFLAMRRLMQNMLHELREIRRSGPFHKEAEQAWMRKNLLGDTDELNAEVQKNLKIAIDQLTKAIQHCSDVIEEGHRAKAENPTGVVAAHSRTISINTSKQLLLNATTLLQAMLESRNKVAA